MISGNPRRAVEVASAGDDLGFAASRVDRYDFIGRFVAIVGVGFSDAEEEFAVWSQGQVSVP